MKRRLPLFRSWLILCCICAQATAQTLLWSEEFNSGSLINPDVWTVETGNGSQYGIPGWGNGELQSYTGSTNNVKVESGHLVITAQRAGDNITSGRIMTQNKLFFQYGTVEARIQTPDLANGLWPAFWTLGNGWQQGVSWPNCGEIDIMEMGSDEAIAVGKINRIVGSHAHWGSLPNHPNYGEKKEYTTDINDMFVTYRMEWTPSAISTYINDQWIWTLYISGEFYKPEFHKPHFFLLNMAVGGQYTGILNAEGITADFPAEYRVDWIRIYDNGHTMLGGDLLETPAIPSLNYLHNPGLEYSVISPWVGYFAGVNTEGGYIEDPTYTYYNGGASGGDNVLTRSGQYVAKVFGGYTGSPNYNGFYQDVAAAPGSIWTASGWALTHPQDLMVGANTAWIEVSFLDAVDTTLALYRSPILTSSNITPGTWMNLEVTDEYNPSTYTYVGSVDELTAPTGTTKARYQIVYRQPLFDGGSVYFDDLSLVEQILPFTLDASMAGGNMQIRFPAQSGVSYDVVYKSSLTNANWIPVETIIGDGTTNTIVYPMGDPVRFYKVSTP